MLQPANPISVPTWRRPERWLAFVLTLLGVCSFLAIVPSGVEPEAASFEEAPPIDLGDSFIAQLRESASGLQVSGHWTALLPPLVAVMVAAFFRSMVGALGCAFAAGAFLSYGLNPLATAILAVYDFLILPIWSQFSALIILFLFSLVGMTHVMSRSGGLAGLVGKMAIIAKGRRRAKVAIGLGGLLIFFDDYSNTVVLGATMRKLSDRWRISREKLAYIVDTTTAPVAGVALLSTWVAFEANLVGVASAQLGFEMSGYGMLMEMLPMRFYCIGALVFMFLSSALGRDFGPMLKAERRAFREGKLVADGHETLGIPPSRSIEPDPDTPERWFNAVIPIAVVIVSILIGIVALGAIRIRLAGIEFDWQRAADWRDAFSATVYNPADENGPGAMPVLFVASLIGGATAILLAVGQRILTVRQAARAYVQGMPTMWMAVFILAMTWSMREICQTLGTAEYLIALMGDNMPLWMLPFLTFLVAAGMSFATGTSWGSMGILIPIILPLAAEMGALEPANLPIYFLTAAAVLDGSIFGDHCSPISDTTVLTSISTNCDHIAHVSTQLYYAIATMILVALLGYFAVSAGAPLWSFYFLFPLLSLGTLYALGKRVEK